MIKTDKTKYKAAVTLRKGRRNPVKINREEIDEAMKDFMKKGGEVIRLNPSDDKRGLNERPVDPIDLLEKYNGSL